MDHSAKDYQEYLNGNDNALVSIINTHKDALIFYLYGFTKDLHAAEDLAEDTFFRLAVKKPRFGGESTFKTWLFSVARNLALDHLRRQKRLGLVPAEDGLFESVLGQEFSAEDGYFKEARKQILEQMMLRLPRDYRTVLFLVYFEQFAPREVAKILKKSMKQTENLLYRAKGAMREKLTQEGYTYEDLI